MRNPRTVNTVPLARKAKDERSEEQIRRRAYQLYEARGRGDGHDVEDWLEAEAEIVGRPRGAAA